MDEFIIFNTNIEKLKTKPNPNKFRPISTGIEVNNPVRIIVFKMIALFIRSILKIVLL